jgi:hypothetical protein
MAAAAYENPFPTRTAVAHEVGHLIIVCLLSPNFRGGISFMTRDRTSLAQTQFQPTGLSDSDRVAIAVAGMVGVSQSAIGNFVEDGPMARDFFTRTLVETSLTHGSDQAIAWDLAVSIGGRSRARAVILQKIGDCEDLFDAIGGPPLVAEIALGVMNWLEANNRSSWRVALAKRSALACVVFSESNFYDLLKVIGQTNASLRDGCDVLRWRIDGARSRRTTP